MDYKQLLKKYINHVGNEEGTTFINRAIPNSPHSDYPLTEEEVAELKRLDKEIIKERMEFK